MYSSACFVFYPLSRLKVFYFFVNFFSYTRVWIKNSRPVMRPHLVSHGQKVRSSLQTRELQAMSALKRRVARGQLDSSIWLKRVENSGLRLSNRSEYSLSAFLRVACIAHRPLFFFLSYSPPNFFISARASGSLSLTLQSNWFRVFFFERAELKFEAESFFARMIRRRYKVYIDLYSVV